MNILVIGDTLIDKYIYVDRNRKSPEDATIDVVDINRTYTAPGGCLNVAANIASLSETQVTVSSILSPSTCRRISFDYNVKHDPQLCVMIKPCLELKKNRIIDNATHKQLIRIDLHHSFDRELRELYNNRIACYYDKLKAYDAIVVSDYNKGVIDDNVISNLSTVQCPVFIDTKKTNLKIWDKIPNRIIKINEHEHDKANYNNVKNKGAIIITLGKWGAYWKEHAIFKTQSVGGEDFKDCIGAGDVFLAGLAVKYLKSNGNIKQAIRYANLAAGRSVRYRGTYIVRPDDVLEKGN